MIQFQVNPAGLISIRVDESGLNALDTLICEGRRHQHAYFSSAVEDVKNNGIIEINVYSEDNMRKLVYG